MSFSPAPALREQWWAFRRRHLPGVTTSQSTTITQRAHDLAAALPPLTSAQARLTAGLLSRSNLNPVRVETSPTPARSLVKPDIDKAA